MRARRLWPAAVLLGALAAVLLPAGLASAHPLGNFTVNQLDALDLYPDRIDLTATVDSAELPTLQELSTVDTNGDGTVSDAERAAYARSTCGTLAGNMAVTAGGHRLVWTVEDGATFGYAPGAAGLSTSRLDCRLSAPAKLDVTSTVDVDNRYRSDRIGWREMTAAGHGIRLVDSPLPSTSVSDGLRAYPQDLLASPLNVRSAHLTTVPGTAAAASVPAAAAPVRSPGGLTGWAVRTERSLQGLVGGRHLTPLVGVVAVLLAIVLGAGHAALPGHGKTVMAVYLTGQAGRIRDALGVAATVTLTHTGGVLVLGLLLTSVGSLAGETALGWLGVFSGVTVAAVGLGMLLSARRRAPGHHHRHAHPHGHTHEHGVGHSHVHARGGGRPSRFGIVGMGVAGGLVPSPSALVILLGAIGLGRTAFGILLVVGYGLGMAATLTAAGFALVLLRRRWAARLTPSGTRWSRLSRFAPTGTAALVLLVGVGLAGRALAGMVQA